MPQNKLRLQHVLSQQLTAPNKLLFDPDQPEPIFVFGEVNLESMQSAVKDIARLNAQSSKTGTVIRIMINSDGGFVNAATGLIDIMRMSHLPIATVVMGEASSMAQAISMMGTPGLRFATEHSHLMCHQIAAGSERSKIHELRDLAKHWDASDAKLIKWFKAGTGHSKSYIRKHFLGPGESYFSAEEAVKHNLIDHVIKGH